MISCKLKMLCAAACLALGCFLCLPDMAWAEKPGLERRQPVTEDGEDVAIVLEGDPGKPVIIYPAGGLISPDALRSLGPTGIKKGSAAGSMGRLGTTFTGEPIYYDPDSNTIIFGSFESAFIKAEDENTTSALDESEADLNNAQADDDALDQAEAALISIVAALEYPAKNNLDQQAVNRALQAVGDNILNNSNAATATVAGNLHQASATNIGSFDFQVNLGSGDISKARMNASDLGKAWVGGNLGGSVALSGGTGKLSGNDFSVGGLTGNVIDNGGLVLGPAVGSLSGTATDGFKALNNNSISNGQYTIKDPGGVDIGSGTISGGRVN